MTRHVSISEFKDHASEFIAAAENGEDIVLTRHGKPTVTLRRTVQESETYERAQKALARMMARRAEMRKAGMTATIEELIAWKNEGQR